MHSVDRPYDEGRGRGGQPPHEDGVEQGHAGARLLLEVRLEGEERPPAQHLVQYSTVQYSTIQYSTVQYSTWLLVRLAAASGWLGAASHCTSTRITSAVCTSGLAGTEAEGWPPS